MQRNKKGQFVKGQIPHNKKEIKWEINESGCWVCNSHALSSGYPISCENGIPTRINKIMYERFVGTVPSGMFICHKCDNRLCINPDHLFIGTPKENSQDMRNKNRQEQGSQRYNAKLTEEQVLEIKKMKGLPLKEIAKKYNVSFQLISNILLNKVWKHVKEV